MFLGLTIFFSSHFVYCIKFYSPNSLFIVVTIIWSLSFLWFSFIFYLFFSIINLWFSTFLSMTYVSTHIIPTSYCLSLLLLLAYYVCVWSSFFPYYSFFLDLKSDLFCYLSHWPPFFFFLHPHLLSILILMIEL